jgi:hypothetical protein
MAMGTTRRTLFSVIEVTDAVGVRSFEVDWHPELYPLLDEVSPDGQITDKLVGIAETLLDGTND